MGNSLGIRDSKLKDTGRVSGISSMSNNHNDHENSDKYNYYYDGNLALKPA